MSSKPLILVFLATALASAGYALEQNAFLKEIESQVSNTTTEKKDTPTAIAETVNRNWVISSTAAESENLKGLSLVVQISLSPKGELTGLKITKSSGNKAFDDSLIRAVRKSMPLPIPADKLAEYSEFEMAFGQ